MYEGGREDAIKGDGEKEEKADEGRGKETIAWMDEERDKKGEDG